MLTLVALVLTLATAAAPGHEEASVLFGKRAAPLSVTLVRAEAPSPDAPATFLLRVHNTSPKAASFCTYHTPFEGFRAPFLDVRRADGSEVPYTGPLVKRGKPGPEDSLHLAPGETREVPFDVAKRYALEAPGRYTVQFKGNPHVNGLPDSEVVPLELP